ncbi:MAG: hypothetical protein ABJH45_09880 [Paracoccaceae bacterium]
MDYARAAAAPTSQIAAVFKTSPTGEAYTQAAFEMRSEGLMSFTDVSIKANVHMLMGRAMGLVDNLNPSGKAKLPKTEDFSQPPAPRTLRRWLAAVNEFDRKGSSWI